MKPRSEAWCRKVISQVLESWRKDKSLENARSVTMWMGVVAKVAPGVINGSR